MPAERPFDFSSPFLEAAIITHEGKRFPLIPGEGLNIGDNRGPLAMSWVSDVQVIMTLPSLPKIRVTLTPPIVDAIRFLDSELIEWGRSAIQVRFGYSGGAPEGPVVSPVYTALMLKPEISIGADVSITLHGQGVYSLLQGARNFQLPREGAEGVTRREILHKVIRGPDPKNPRNLILDTKKADADSEVTKLLDERLTNFSGNNRADWDILYDVAAQCRCWPILRPKALKDADSGAPDVVELVPKAYLFSQGPRKRFVLYHSGERFGPKIAWSSKGFSGDGVYPLTSYSTPASAVYLPGAMQGLVMHGFIANDSTVPESRVGKGGGAHRGSPETPEPEDDPAANPTGDGLVRFFADSVDSEAMALVRSELEEMRLQLGVRAECSSVGVPDLYPGEVVRIEGVGERLSFNYAVYEVTHHWGTGGAETTFTGVSNLSQVAAEVAKLTSPGNNKEPEAEIGIDVAPIPVNLGGN